MGALIGLPQRSNLGIDAYQYINHNCQPTALLKPGSAALPALKEK
jgi:hypothetical protein